MSSIRGFNIKNHGRYYPYIIDVKDLNLDKILVYKRQFTKKNIYHVANKTSNCEKPLRVSFSNVYGYIEKDGRDSYLTLIPFCKDYEQLFGKNKCLIQKQVIFQMFIIATI